MQRATGAGVAPRLRLVLRGSKQVAEKPNGFAHVPLGDYLRRSEWRVPVTREAVPSEAAG